MTSGVTILSGSIKGNCLFFTGGVDSFFTLYKNFNDIDTLIYVFGFDILQDQYVYFNLARERLLSAAAIIGKPIAILRTNYRDVVSYERWIDEYTNALAFASEWLKGAGASKIYASDDDSGILWKKEFINKYNDSFIPYGGAKRCEKIKYLCAYTVAIKYLRVCWETSSEYNCGKCEKCLRTMVPLYVYGKLTEAPFGCNSEAVLVQRMESLYLKTNTDLYFAKENFEISDGRIKTILAQKIRDYEKANP